MSRSMFAVVVFALMLVTGPLPGQDAPVPSAVKDLPDAALPPELDRVIRDYERAWRAGDAVALASLFAEDGFVLQSNRPTIRGRTAIQAAYDGQAGGPLRLRALAFASGDTIAYIIGGYGYGNKPGETGKFTLTLRRAPGEPWLIYSDMDNLNAAPHAPSSSRQADHLKSHEILRARKP
jgi:ketosteroid isomerase-like protein